jgi:hypothetical protein
MRAFLILLFLGQFLCANCQEIGDIDIIFKNCFVENNLIDSLNPNSFEFEINYNFYTKDTIFLSINYHDGQKPFLRYDIKHISDLRSNWIHNIRLDGAKPGYQVMFSFNINGKNINYNYTINSTTFSNLKPYFVKLYFIHNADTISTDNFRVSSKLKQEKNTNHVKIFYNEPKDLPINIQIIYEGQLFMFELTTKRIADLYRGIIIISLDTVTSKKKKTEIKKKQLKITDLDTNLQK